MAPHNEKVRVKLRRTVDHSYNIVIGRDLFDGIAVQLKEMRLADRYVLISDSTVLKLHGNRLTEALRARGLKVDRIGFPAGESSKTRKMKQFLEEHMLGMGLARDTCVIACGGGVTGDLAGFTAATYLRGVPWIQVPTTLLAMVDASIGGKTAVDVAEGKNLIGAFHQPAAVFIDVSALETLPRRHLVAGMAEVIKHAVIADADFFKQLMARADDVLEGDPAAQIAVIKRSCEIKAGVVEKDEKEADLRRILNYGHTLGHAVEAASGYALLHGEAVSLGMALEGALAVSQEIFSPADLERQHALLKRVGLPIKASVVLRALIGHQVRPRDILEYTHFDKKKRLGLVEYALPVKIGQMKRLGKRVGIPFDDKVMIQFLRRVFH
ncbi:MAG TPA: 3-dehydroquinate synthase [bacterium]|nr:3-dehydroquinate synthase [bacterium]